MSWHPNDLVADVDLVDYESRILTQFGAQSWLPRRTKALEDFVFPVLRANGLDPYALRTRRVPDAAFGYTGSVYTSILAVVSNSTEDDLSLASLFATPGTDAIFIASRTPFRGVFLRLLDAVSSVAGKMSVAYWNGNWEPLTVSDRTIQVSGKTLSGGGSVLWTLPPDWVTRKVNAVGPYYWARIMVSATPTGATLSQVGCVLASALRAPATFKTLELIMREAPTGADGPWLEKAAYYASQFELAMQRALPRMGEETDTDGDDVIDAEEATQTSESVGGGWRLERG
jgi:hypothetical protein